MKGACLKHEASPVIVTHIIALMYTSIIPALYLKVTADFMKFTCFQLNKINALAKHFLLKRTVLSLVLPKILG